MPFLRDLLGRARVVAGRVKRNFTHVEVAGSAGDGAFGLIGGDVRMQHQFARVYLHATDGVQLRRRWHGSDWSRVAESMLARHGLVVVSDVVIPASIAPRLVRVPRLVGFRIDTREPEEVYSKKLPGSARSDVAKIRKAGFHSVVRNDPAWAVEFFERYHAPSIARRFGGEAKLITIEQITEIIVHHAGEFFCIMDGARCIAAGVRRPEGDTYHMELMGLLDGDPALGKAGAQSALYWFSIQSARERRLSWVHTGGALPYLEDGVLRYKTKWNPELGVYAPAGADYHVLIEPSHLHVRRMIAGQSMIVRAADGRFLVLSGKSPGDLHLPQSVSNGIARWYRLREAADASGSDAIGDLPAHMRAWFTEETLPRG